MRVFSFFPGPVGWRRRHSMKQTSSNFMALNLNSVSGCHSFVWQRVKASSCEYQNLKSVFSWWTNWIIINIPIINNCFYLSVWASLAARLTILYLSSILNCSPEILSVCPWSFSLSGPKQTFQICWMWMHENFLRCCIIYSLEWGTIFLTKGWFQFGMKS